MKTVIVLLSVLSFMSVSFAVVKELEVRDITQTSESYQRSLEYALNDYVPKKCLVQNTNKICAPLVKKS